MRCLSLVCGALITTFAWANVLAQTPAVAPPSGPIPIEHFTKFDEFGGVKISPDGEFIAVLTGKYGRSTILFTDLKAKKIVSGIRTPEDCEIDEYHWISPTRLIYTIAQRQRANVRPTPTGEIFGDQSRRQRQPAAVRLPRRAEHARYAHQEARGQLRDGRVAELAQERSEPRPHRRVSVAHRCQWLGHQPGREAADRPPRRLQRRKAAARHGAARRCAAAAGS